MNPSSDARRAAGVRTALALVVVALAAIALRTCRLDRESAQRDEAVMLRNLDAPTVGAFFRASGEIDLIPVYYLAEYYWGQCVGTSVARVRLLSIVFGVGALIVVSLIARLLYGAAAGTASAVVMAASLTQIYYAQEIRMYSLVLLLSAISVYALLKALHQGRWTWWAVHVFANGLLPLTHLMAVLLVVVEAAFLAILWRRQLLRFLCWGLAHVVAFTPLAIWLMRIRWDFVMGGTEWIEPWGPLTALWKTLLFFTGAFTAAAWQGPRVGVVLGLMLLLFEVAAIVAWIAVLCRRREAADSTVPSGRVPGPRQSLTLLVAWLAVPPLMLFVLSHTWKPCFVERYFLASTAPFCILLGATFAALPTRRAQTAAAVAFALLSGYQLTLLAQPLRSDWRDVAQRIQREGAGQDIVLVAPEWQRESFRFYSPLPSRQVLQIRDWNQVYLHARDMASSNANLWLVVWPEWYQGDLRNLEDGLAARGIRYTRTFSRGLIPPIIYKIERMKDEARSAKRNMLNAK